MSNKRSSRVTATCWILALFLACGLVAWGTPDSWAGPQSAPPAAPGAAPQLLLSPQRVVLDAQFGSSATLTQDIDVSELTSGAATTYAASIQSGSDWLMLGTAVSGTTVTWGSTVTATTPAVLRVFVKVNAMALGINTGIVALNITGGSSNPVLLPIIVNVRGKPNLIVSPTTMSFSHQAGNIYSTPQPQNLSVYGASTGFRALVTTLTGQNWLKVSAASGTTPARLSVSVEASQLDPGDYVGSISVLPQGTQNGYQTVNVSLKVTSASSFFPTQQTVTLRAQYGSHHPVSDIAQFYTNGFVLPVSTSVLNGSWLSATALDAWAGEADPSTAVVIPVPARVQVSADPTGLAVGTYTSSLTVGDADSGATIPVTLQVVPNDLTVPHLIDGGGTSTAITLVNSDQEPAPFTIKFHHQDGSPWKLSLDVADSVSEYSSTIPVGGIRIIHTLDAGSDTSQGWAEIVPQRSIAVTASFVQLGLAGFVEGNLPAGAPAGPDFLLPFDDTNGVQSSFALVNSGAADSTVNVTVRDESGNTVATASTTVPASGKAILESQSIFPQLVNHRGLAEFKSPGGKLSAVGLQVDSLGSTVTYQAIVPEHVDAPTTVRSLPLAVDSLDWSTTLVLANPGSQAMPFTLVFRNAQTGTAEPFQLSGIGAVTEYSDVIPAGGIRILDSAGLSSPLAQVWAEIASFGKLEGTLLFAQRQITGSMSIASMPFSDPTTDDFIVPFDNSSDLQTALALLNNTADDGTSRVSVRDEDGNWLSTAYLTTTSEKCETFFLSSLFPKTAGIRGTVQFSGAEVSALGLRFSSLGTFTSVPALNR